MGMLPGMLADCATGVMLEPYRDSQSSALITEVPTPKICCPAPLDQGAIKGSARLDK